MNKTKNPIAKAVSKMLAKVIPDKRKSYGKALSKWELLEAMEDKPTSDRP